MNRRPNIAFRPEKMTGGIGAPLGRRAARGSLERFEALKLPVIFGICLLGWLLLPGCAEKPGAYWGPTDQALLDAGRAAPGKVLVIEASPGGNRLEARRIFATLMAEGIRVRLTGLCASACTVALAYPNVCYRPDTLFAFHAVSNPDGRLSPWGTKALFLSYPPRIAAWAKQAGADTSAYMTEKIWGHDLALLDDAPRLCGEPS